VATFEDLGIQQAPHSTLNSYLEKLLYLLTGNFAKRGGMNIHTRMASLGGGREGGRTTPVGGHKIITGLVPANVIADEILTEHPKRFRAMIVESANPAHSLADSPRMRAALAALELVVVIDVAMTETAQLAHYILPAASQFEKWEATFFNLEFPRNYFQLRAPLLAPLPGTLAEPEIHRRLVRALGALRDEDLVELHAAAARIATEGRGPLAEAFFLLSASRPQLVPLAPVALYETLGPTLPAGAEATAVLWGAAQLCAMSFPESVRRAGFVGEGAELGDRLFAAMLSERSGITFTVDDYAESWTRIETPDRRIRLAIPELLAELAGLPAEGPGGLTGDDPQFPFVLSAGERRTSTANTIFRDPAWRKKDPGGALRLSPQDGARLGIADGGRARVTTRTGSLVVGVEITDTLQPGHATLPNGLGLSYPDAEGHPAVQGAAPNELTATSDRDWLSGTPWHKHVAARIEVP
jgi:anaerobic selenocysteine-containing dehydrogenase